MSDPDALIDVSEMFAVHDAMRKEYGSLPLLVNSIAAGDTERAAVVSDHVALMGRLMWVHHQGEDELLWPLVEQRAPEHEAVFIMESEHSGMNGSLRTIDSLADTWRIDPSAANRAALHSELVQFEKELLKHLGHEERELLPILQQLLTQEEFGALGAYVRSGLTPQQRTLALGLILEDTSGTLGVALLEAMDPATRADFEAFGKAQVREYRRHLLAMN
jgi:iron-sulfur cluster repair protein YtfE (RIC family)